VANRPATNADTSTGIEPIVSFVRVPMDLTSTEKAVGYITTHCRFMVSSAGDQVTGALSVQSALAALSSFVGLLHIDLDLGKVCQ
jgi:hypothetical protein